MISCFLYPALYALSGMARTARTASRRRNHPLHHVFSPRRQSKRARRRERGRAKGARK